jgi:hypothetical protein
MSPRIWAVAPLGPQWGGTSNQSSEPRREARATSRGIQRGAGSSSPAGLPLTHTRRSCGGMSPTVCHAPAWRAAASRWFPSTISTVEIPVSPAGVLVVNTLSMIGSALNGVMSPLAIRRDSSTKASGCRSCRCPGAQMIWAMGKSRMSAIRSSLLVSWCTRREILQVPCKRARDPGFKPGSGPGKPRPRKQYDRLPARPPGVLLARTDL